MGAHEESQGRGHGGPDIDARGVVHRTLVVNHESHRKTDAERFSVPRWPRLAHQDPMSAFDSFKLSGRTEPDMK